jgi:hypothetical protein
MSFTDGISYNDVLTLIQSGNALEDWRVASFSEVVTMYQGFGFTVTPDNNSGTYYPANHAYGLVLNTLGSTYGNIGSYAFTVGYVSDVGSSYSGRDGSDQRTVQTGYFADINKGFWRGDSWGSEQGTSNSSIGTHLTRRSQDVPEPSTLAIFALGMIGLASRRFKKQS